MRLRRSSSLSSVSTSTLLPRILRILVMCVSLSSLLSTTTPVFWHSIRRQVVTAICVYLESHCAHVSGFMLHTCACLALRILESVVVLLRGAFYLAELRSWAVFTLDLRGLRGAINFECVELITLFVGIFDVQPLLHFREGRGRLHYLPRL
ncbi:hypothetical protein KC348_g68 [Hortaea werneckii]|nr:hypothetical protein KC348_g68 [Hortaea werneckii]